MRMIRLFSSRKDILPVVLALVWGTACAEGAASDARKGQSGLAATLTVGSAAEWHRPVEVLMHTPGDEIFVGVIHPAAALFERPFALSGARREHEAYVHLLEQEGARVHRVVGRLAGRNAR